MHRLIQNIFQQNVQIGEIFQNVIFCGVLIIHFRHFTERTNTIGNASIRDLLTIQLFSLTSQNVFNLDKVNFLT